MLCYTINILLLSVLVLICGAKCISLDELHSSSNQFKSISHNNRDNSLKNAIQTIHRRRQENPFAHLYGPYSLPLQAIQYYKTLDPTDNTQDVQIPLEYSNEDDYSDESPTNDLYMRALALKLSKLSDYNNDKESDVSDRLLNKIKKKKKRSTSKPIDYSKQSSVKTKAKDLNKDKHIVKNKNTLIKVKTKRNSGRRVLEDHFNVEENKQNVIKSNSKFPKTYPLSLISISKSNQNFKNKNRKQTKVKKMIAKRKVDPQMAFDKNDVYNESQTKAKELKTTDKTVVSELNDILLDDNKAEHMTESKQNVTNVSNNKFNDSLSNETHTNKSKVTLIKTKNKRSSPLMDRSLDEQIDDINNNNENIIVYPIEKIDEKSELRIGKTSDSESPIDSQQLDEWLRREYYENIAKALATMRKKRSEDSFDYNLKNDENEDNDDLDDSDSIADNIIANDNSNDNNNNENMNKDVEKLLDQTDDYVVAAIDDDIDSNDNNNQKEENNDKNERKDGEEEENESDDSDLWDIIEEKNSKQTVKRSVNPEVEEVNDDNEESNDIDVDSHRFSRINTKLESIEDSLLNEAIGLIRDSALKGSQSDAQSSKIEHRLNAAYDIEDMRTTLKDLHQTADKIDDEKDKNNDFIVTLNNDLATNLNDNQIDQNNIDFDNSLLASKSTDNCFAIEMLSSDCTSVGDLMPNPRLSQLFTEACNWHNICYTCGEVYGLLSSDCDAGFLEASRLVCNDSPSCESFARLVLKPLRQSRVFYKSSVPQTCFQYKCLKHFLFNSQTTKR